MKRIYTFGIGVIIVAIVVGIVLVERPEARSIHIGGLFPLTGGLASYGEPARNAALLAVKDINTAGGVHGKKLELNVEDHACDAPTALSAFQKLVTQHQIHFFTSAACTATVVALVPSLEKNDALLLGTITSGNKLTGISTKFYRNWASDAQEARLLADKLITSHAKKVAIIYEETDYAKGLKLSLDSYLSGSGIQIVSESFSSGTTDVRTQLTKLMSQSADVFFVSVQTVTSGEVVLSQMEQLRITPKQLLINDNILKSTKLVGAHRVLLEGAIGGDYAFESTPGLQSFLRKYKDEYGTECPQVNICAAEYDAVHMIAQAYGATDGSVAAVTKYLSTMTYNGLSGEIGFDANNDRRAAQYSLFTVINGHIEIIK